MDIDIQQIAENFIATKSSKDFAALYNRLEPGIRNYIKPFIRDFNDKFNDVENEIVANTFVKIYTKIDQYNPEYKFSTWVYSIAKYTAWAEYSRMKKLIYLSSYKNEAGEELDVSVFDDLINRDDYTSIIDIELREELLEKQKLYEKAINAINNLGEKHKDILIDRELNKMKYEDLADKYKLPLNTLKSRIHCGRLKVREKIRKFIED